MRRAWGLGLGALVEVHDVDELAGRRRGRRAHVGVNSRNLRTLEVDVRLRGPRCTDAARRRGRQRERAAQTRELVSLRAAGYDGFLIGERLMAEPRARTRAGRLIDAVARGLRRCSSRSAASPDWRMRELAVTAGANAVGFVFWRPAARASSRRARQRASRAACPPFVTRVGVFVNQPAAAYRRRARRAGLGAVQLHGDERPRSARNQAAGRRDQGAGRRARRGGPGGAGRTRVTAPSGRCRPANAWRNGPRRPIGAAAARLPRRRPTCWPAV